MQHHSNVSPTLPQIEAQLRATRFAYDVARTCGTETPEALADMLDGIRTLVLQRNALEAAPVSDPAPGAALEWLVDRDAILEGK